MPEWLIELCTAEAEGGHEPVGLEGVPEGERDNAIYKLACKLRGAGIERDVVEDLVLKKAAACVPPFPADDALKKVESAWRHAPDPVLTIGKPKSLLSNRHRSPSTPCLSRLVRSVVSPRWR